MAAVKNRSRPKPIAKAAQRKDLKKVALEQLRDDIQKQVGREAQAIVEGLIEEAKKGYCSQAKYLFEIIGLYPVMAGQEVPQQPSLAQTLLNRLGFPEGPGPETEVMREDDRQETVVRTDAVE